MDRPGKHTTPALRTHHLRGFASGQNAACAGSFWRESMQLSRFAGSLTRSGGRGPRLNLAYHLIGDPVKWFGRRACRMGKALAGEGIRGATAAGPLPLEPTYHRIPGSVNHAAERIRRIAAARGNPPVRDLRESTTSRRIRQPSWGLTETQPETDTLCM